KPAHDEIPTRCQTAHLVPAARFCARVLKLWLSAPEGWRSAGSRRVLARHPWPALGGRRRLGGGAFRPSTWDARLPALSPWRFWAGRARFPHRTCVRIGQRAPRTRGVVPEGEVSSPVASGCEPLPRDATPRSVLRIVSRARPLLSKARKILATLRKLRSRKTCDM